MPVLASFRSLAAWLALLMGAVTQEASGAPPAAAAACSRGQASAFREIACEVAAGFGGTTSPLAIASGPARGLAPGSRSDQLSQRLADGVASARASIGAAPSRVLPGAPALAAARALSGKGAPLLYLRPELAGGELRVVASLHVPGRTIWDRVKAPSPEPRAGASSARPVDAEIQAFVGKVSLAALAPAVKVPHGMPDVVAVACGPLTGLPPDGALEVVLVGRQRIAAGHVRGGRFVVRAETQWAALSAVAASPLREPIGSASIVPGVSLTAGSSDRARGVLLTPALTPHGTFEAQVPWAGVGCLGRSGLGLGNAAPCSGTPPEAPRVTAPPTPVDAIAGALTVRPSGELRAVAASREPSTLLTLRDSDGKSVQLPRVGAALAVADPDRDGQVELVSSEAVRNAKDDAIVVRTWTGTGAIEERLRLPVPDGVRALGACPPDGPGPSPLVVATPREPWIVR